MIRIREIDHVVLRVSDLGKMIRFYCEVLGCSIEKRQDKFGLIQLRAGRCLVDLVDIEGEIGRQGGAAPTTGGRNMDHVCFRVEPFNRNDIVAHLSAHGIAVSDPVLRYGAEGSGLSFYVSDPENNTIELKGPPDLSVSA